MFVPQLSKNLSEISAPVNLPVGCDSMYRHFADIWWIIEPYIFQKNQEIDHELNKRTNKSNQCKVV